VHTLSAFMRVFETPVDTYGRFFVLAHDDARIRTPDEVAAVRPSDFADWFHEVSLFNLITTYMTISVIQLPVNCFSM
jgi:hypothetical protein